MKPDTVRRLGLTPMIDERHKIVLKYSKGKLLDIGCGENFLIKQYKNGVGADVFPWKGIDVLVDTRHLPFCDESFDTITFMASLNHIPKQKRKEVLNEAKRVLKNNGCIIITMITPKLSYFGHNFLWGWRDPDIKKRGMKEGEEWGFYPKEIRLMLKEEGFEVVSHKKFLYALNHLYVAVKSNK